MEQIGVATGLDGFIVNVGKICEGDFLFSDEHACILRIVYCLIVLSACRCHGLSLLEFTLQLARRTGVSPCCRDSAVQSEFFLRVSRLKTFN